jgi:RNA polymerase subunit RPABC4/transcription elongation factor Spt4
MFGSWQPLVALVAAILIAYAVILLLGTVVWVYRDIRERTRDTWSQTISWLLVVIFNLPGLILYLVLRPRETLLESYERRLETEALMGDMPERRACPSCQRPAHADYLVCPYCRTGLRQACSNCHKPLELTWIACPYCGAQGPQQMVVPTTPFAGSGVAAQTTPTAPLAPEPAQRSTGRTSP